MNNTDKHILLVNDDGINSPGLWAAAEALSSLGYVTVAAPREQWSGAGRSHPATSDGMITSQKLEIHGKEWTVYAVGGSPAQTVVHAMLEICPQKPNLIVSGINYGENAGSGATNSGTVGAAIEGACYGIPSLALSLEMDQNFHFSYSTETDFSGAKHFTNLFARMLLDTKMPADVDLLKVEIPSSATSTTGWKLTRLSRLPYYYLSIPERADVSTPTKIRYRVGDDIDKSEMDSDIHALAIERLVSVTPMSFDFSSRVDLTSLANHIGKEWFINGE